MPRVNEAVRRLRPCRVLSPSAAAAAEGDDNAASGPGLVDQACCYGHVTPTSCGWCRRGGLWVQSGER